jgi:hypothetical protein|tara:strand:- start:312 stop:722 length:411 start_codon:yes stop_codon:yes gene_type:complete
VQDFHPVVFATLTEPNGTRLVKLLDDISKFIRDLSFQTKTHVKPMIGYEDGENSHAHLILCVPDDELETFQSRLEGFVPWKSWRFRTLDFQPFIEGAGDTHSYVLNKHNALLPETFCPKKYSACRKGKCAHKHHQD